MKNKLKTGDLIKRYIWLMNILMEKGPISRNDIEKEWKRSTAANPDGINLPRETFIHHKEAVEMIFDVTIECDRRTNKYSIANDFSIEERNIRRWMMESLSMSQLLQENRHIQDRIIFESCDSKPCYLQAITTAMSENKVIDILYQTYDRNVAYLYTIRPYCLKNFRQQWYLVGYCENKQQIRIYALDRIKSIEKKDQTFKSDNEFNPKEYFSSCFGIIADERITPQIIQISANEMKANYLRSVPLHHSQEETGKEGDKFIFNYYMRPTYDLNMELLRHGKDIQVISPKSLRDEIARIVAEMHQLYSNACIEA